MSDPKSEVQIGVDDLADEAETESYLDFEESDGVSQHLRSVEMLWCGSVRGLDPRLAGSYLRERIWERAIAPASVAIRSEGPATDAEAWAGFAAWAAEVAKALTARIDEPPPAIDPTILRNLEEALRARDVAVASHQDEAPLGVLTHHDVRWLLHDVYDVLDGRGWLKDRQIAASSGRLHTLDEQIFHQLGNMGQKRDQHPSEARDEGRMVLARLVAEALGCESWRRGRGRDYRLPPS